MKKIYKWLLVLIICLSLTGCAGTSESILRIHIRANSNNETDQLIKLDIRDSIIDYITPLIEDCDDSEEVKNILNENLENIKNISDAILISNGFNYLTSASICNEFFPSRQYDGVVFPSDYYDALIIKLGNGTGDNWWCVAYPPLCFVGEDNGTKEVKYRSKLVEIINNLIKG